MSRRRCCKAAWSAISITASAWAPTRNLTGAFEEAGLELPPLDWTWADFEATAVALHENLGIWGMTEGSSGLSDVQIWRSLYVGMGTNVLNEELNALSIDEQPTIDHFNMMLRLQETPCEKPPNFVSHGRDVSRLEQPCGIVSNRRRCLAVAAAGEGAVSLGLSMFFDHLAVRDARHCSGLHQLLHQQPGSQRNPSCRAWCTDLDRGGRASGIAG
jgi:hypothetical protein